MVEVPPGVDVDEFVLQEPRRGARGAARRGARRSAQPREREERLPDEGNAERLAEFLAADEPTVVYFGKLIEQKGVQVLLEAMARVDARLVVVGFGPYRGDARGARTAAATLFTGPLEHRHLVHLLPLADVTVVPSIFPEAFGMVAAEAAAAGSPPLVARHSGLAEVAAGLEEDYPARLRRPRRRSRPATPPTSPRSSNGSSRSRRAEHDAAPRSRRARRSSTRWSWASVAAAAARPV